MRPSSWLHVGVCDLILIHILQQNNTQTDLIESFHEANLWQNEFMKKVNISDYNRQLQWLFNYLNALCRVIDKVLIDEQALGLFQLVYAVHYNSCTTTWIRFRSS